MVGGSGVRCALGALVACLAIAIGAGPALAQEPVKVLVFHGPPDATTAAGVAAIEDLGAANDFGVDATASAAQLTTATLAGYRALVFLNTAGADLSTAQDAARRGLCQGRRRLPGHRQRRADRVRRAVLRPADRRPAERPEPGGHSEQTVVAGDRVHPSTRNLPLAWNRSDTWYTWQQRRPARSRRCCATTRSTGPRATAPTSAAPTSRSPGAGTSRRAARSTPAWAAPPRASARTAFRTTCSARSSGRPACCAATARPRSRAATPARRSSAPAPWTPARPRRASRTASSWRPTAGSSTSAAATAARTPSAASSSGCRCSGASSTTRTSASASAAARSTSGIPTMRTGRSTAA